jgi:hypothetical protein
VQLLISVPTELDADAGRQVKTMRRLGAGTFVALVLIGATAGSAGAAPLPPRIFFGEDLGLGEFTRLPTFSHAAAAEAAFLASLAGVGTQSFESFTTGTRNPSLAFAGSSGTITALLAGSGTVRRNATGTNGFGRYPVAGSQYFDSGSNFSITFSTPIAAFGFYGVDIGDFNGQIVLTLDGTAGSYNLGNTISGPGGSVLFWGLISDVPFTSISFGNTFPGTDVFGFDRMTIGDTGQVVVVPAVEPASAALLALGCAAAAWKKARGCTR